MCFPPTYHRDRDAHVMAYCFSFGQHSGDDQVNGGSGAVPSKRGHLFPFKGFGSGFIISSLGRTVRPFYQEGLSGRGHGRLVTHFRPHIKPGLCFRAWESAPKGQSRGWGHT